MIMHIQRRNSQVLQDIRDTTRTKRILITTPRTRINLRALIDGQYSMRYVSLIIFPSV